MPVKFVPATMSEPNANPRSILKVPAREITILLNLSDFEVIAKGVDIITVNTAIDIMVPSEKNTKNSIPEPKSGVVGNIANITAALPARPWTTPIT